jgi:hypothetical protein
MPWLMRPRPFTAASYNSDILLLPHVRGYLINMRHFLLVLLLIQLCSLSVMPQSPEQLGAHWDTSHVSRIYPSDVRHSDLKKYIAELKGLGLSITEAGKSFGGREIYSIEWGTGPLKVFMWSQMHGDEPTATSALIDMFAFLQRNRETDWVRQISDKITVRAVPMLNPDGSELFQRRSVQGIDINRDALHLVTPEARLLKKLRDDWNPSIGFNLHNQQALTTVGRTPKQAAISLLVVYGDSAKTPNAGHDRNLRLASAMASALYKFIPGHVGRYSDEWTPTAFGDNFSAWGTPTILIETGALYGKDEMFLVKMNYIAFLTALNALASGSEVTQDPNIYRMLPENGSGTLADLVFRGAILAPRNGRPSNNVDIAASVQRRRASFPRPAVIQSVGVLGSLRGLEEYDASAFYVLHRFSSVRPGELAEFAFFRRNRTIDWNAPDFETRFPPDAVLSFAKWIKGEGVVPRK